MASGTSEHLYDIGGSDADNIIAVGYNFTILQFDGTHWSKLASTNRDTLRGVGVGSDTDVHVVGNYGTALHFDGTSWSEMTRLSPGCHWRP